MPVLPPAKTLNDDGDKNVVWLGDSNGWSSNPEEQLATNNNVVSSGGDLGNIAHCCVPSGCPNYYSIPINLNELADAVKVSINMRSTDYLCFLILNLTKY